MLDHYTAHLLMSVLFVIGYFLITVEHFTKINKTTVALLMGVLLWLVQFENTAISTHQNTDQLLHHVSSISQIIFFLLGALTIVETISVHKGFQLISDLINVGSKKKLLWTVGIITFFLSAVLDNLTTTIVMIALISKLLDKSEDRWLIGGGIVIAANAGGAWTPIGDVTTTMLWIGGQLSTTGILTALFVPSFVCFTVSFAALSFMLKGNFIPKNLSAQDKESEPFGNLIFFVGIGALVFVPILKILTGLPPFMGVLLGLGMMWLITDMAHQDKEHRTHLKVPHILTKIDMSGVLFFLGILLAVDALETAGILQSVAAALSSKINSVAGIAYVIGIVSAIVDNVPIVAATMSMYGLANFPMDNPFWEMIAYSAGTGGSLLIIGSAAGVVYMGLEKVSFGWYLKRISLPAFLGYSAGFVVYLLI